MLDKLKDLNKLRKMQSEMKKQLEQIFVTHEKDGIKIVVRGDKHVEKVEIEGDENKLMKDLMNDAMKEVDKKVEKQMRGQLQELGIPGL
jgi:DNA-binding protein YbaB